MISRHVRFSTTRSLAISLALAAMLAIGVSHLARHAKSVQVGGDHTGEMLIAGRFADMNAYVQGVQKLEADAEFAQLQAPAGGASSHSTLVDRSVWIELPPDG
ncbi:MAG: hypothetical protein ACR2PL_25310 [Dehalococcoidia bacterium]